MSSAVSLIAAAGCTSRLLQAGAATGKGGCFGRRGPSAGGEGDPGVDASLAGGSAARVVVSGRRRRGAATASSLRRWVIGSRLTRLRLFARGRGKFQVHIFWCCSGQLQPLSPQPSGAPRHGLGRASHTLPGRCRREVHITAQRASTRVPLARLERATVPNYTCYKMMACCTTVTQRFSQPANNFAAIHEPAGRHLHCGYTLRRRSSGPSRLQQ